MKIPKSIVVNTGEQEEVYRTIERFFAEAEEELTARLKIREGPSDFEIRVNNLYLCDNQPTDNSVHLLLYKDRVIAVVTETRTESNYVAFSFFKDLEFKVD